MGIRTSSDRSERGSLTAWLAGGLENPRKLHSLAWVDTYIGCPGMPDVYGPVHLGENYPSIFLEKLFRRIGEGARDLPEPVPPAHRPFAPSLVYAAHA